MAMFDPSFKGDEMINIVLFCESNHNKSMVVDSFECSTMTYGDRT